MDIELLVLPDCPHAEAARAQIETALVDLCMQEASVRTTTVESMETAAQRGFSGSPTILIDGRDPFTHAETSPALACRVYRTPDGLSGVPGLRDVRRALKEAAAFTRSN
jgi:glutaredoxin